MRSRTLMLVLAPAVFTSSALACGQERWPVKVGQDKQANYLYVDRDISTGELTKSVKTTVAKLNGYPWPFDWKQGAFPQAWANQYRNGVPEFTIWNLNATLLRYHSEADEDYHLVLQSGKYQMIAEIPSPNCVADSPEPIKTMVVQARKDFENFVAGKDAKNLNVKVSLVGIGFHDRVHGNADGQVKANGIELHPVLSIKFK